MKARTGDPHQTLQSARKIACCLPVLLLAACAQQPVATPKILGYRPETVPVVAVWPMAQPEAQAACPADPALAPAGASPAPDAGYCVLYEHQGNTYSVPLPNDPGGSLTLQIPILGYERTAPVPVAPVGVVPMGVAPYPFIYPQVYFYGGYYRSRAYLPPAHRPPPLPRTWVRPPPNVRRATH